MRSYHGALLLVLAMVMAMVSTGICTGTTPPAPAPAPAPRSIVYPPLKSKCWKILANSGCRQNQKACNDNCFTQLKGDGVCLVGNDACWCYYPCGKRPPPPESSW